MKYGRIPFLDKDISKIVCGTDWLMSTIPYTAFEALDAFVEAGGNCLDTAHCYGPNSVIIGAWLKWSGAANQLVFLNKGNHPYGSPRMSESFTRNDVLANHDRLGIEHTDLYVYHRDEQDVPVGEIVDWTNELIKEGLITAWGGSNWTIERIEAANAYAEKNGKQPMSCNNPNLTLAENVKPLWPGCVTIDEAGRKWHEASQMPLFSWSSTARGFFVGIDDPEVVAAYDSPTSRARRDRAEQLGKELGLSTVQVSLAWVLNQSFPTFALCGLRSKQNVSENCLVPDVTLTPEQLRWLEFGD